MYTKIFLDSYRKRAILSKTHTYDITDLSKL